ncbi:MAG: dTDP-4-dehydrorhamnose reductase [Acidobacteriaceae bacterium]
MNADKSRALIVGASGQVGAQLLRLLPAETTTATSREVRPGFEKLDLESIAENDAAADKLLLDSMAGTVYCAGAMTYVDGCESNRGAAIRVNVGAPARLASAAARRGARFVYFSTDYVFDGKAGPYSEESETNPINVYGKSKREGEVAVANACPDALIVRTTGVFGFDEKGKNFLYSLRRALLSGEPFRVPSDQISTPTYNADLATAIIALVAAGATGIFHVAGPELVSRLEFAQRAAAVMGLNASRIEGLSTAELGQIAPRPLLAGLRTEKLTKFVPSVRMRGIEESVRDWTSVRA